MKKGLVIFIISIVAILIIINIVPQRDVIEENIFRMKEGERTKVIAHGGAKQLFPENTIEAFDGVMELGVDILEMDVCLTKDEVVVTHHDKTIDRTSDGSGRVRDYTYEELKNFNFGKKFKALDGSTPYENKKATIISIDELMNKYGKDVPFIIEIKDSEEDGKKAADELIRIIKKYNMENRTIVASFHDEVFNYISDKYSDIMLSPSRGATKNFVINAYTLSSLFFNEDIVALQIPCEDSGIVLDTKMLIKTAHRRNIAVQYWTINDKEKMRELIEKGADGIMTDRPDLMLDLLEEINN